MIENLLFLVTLYYTGLFFCLLLYPGLDIHTINLLSLPAGIAVWVMAGMFIVITGLPFELTTLLLIIFIIYAIFLLGIKISGKVLWWNAIRRQEVFLTALWLVGFGVLVFASLKVRIFSFGLDSLFRVYADSFVYDGLSRILTTYGEISSDHLSFEIFMHSRLIFIPMLQALAFLFGIEFSYLIYPVTASLFVLLFGFLTWKLIANNIAGQNSEITAIIVAVIAGSLLATSRVYIYLANTLHSNFMVTVYFSIALMGIFLWDRKTNAWLIVSAIALALTVLIRKEMAAFALIPIVLLVADKLDFIHWNINKSRVS
jgi:hypothetical protein